MGSMPVKPSWGSGLILLSTLIFVGFQLFVSGVEPAASQNAPPSLLTDMPRRTTSGSYGGENLPSSRPGFRALSGSGPVNGAPVTPGPGPLTTLAAPTVIFDVGNRAWNAGGSILCLTKGGGGILLAEKRNYYSPPPSLTLVESIDSNSLNNNFHLGYRIRVWVNAASPTGFEVGFFHMPSWRESSGELENAGAAFELSSAGLVGPQSPAGDTVQSIGTAESTRLYSIEMNTTRQLGPVTQGLMGIRYVHLEDGLDISAQMGSAAPFFLDETQVDTRVNMLGVQVGAVHSMTISGLDVELNLRAAVLGGHNRQTMNETVYNPSGLLHPIDVSGSRIALGGLLDGRIAARMWFGGSSSLFCGYQFFFLNGIALAPQQLALLGRASSYGLTVTDTPGSINDRNSMTLHGFLAGFQLLW